MALYRVAGPYVGTERLTKDCYADLFGVDLGGGLVWKLTLTRYIYTPLLHEYCSVQLQILEWTCLLRTMTRQCSTLHTFRENI